MKLRSLIPLVASLLLATIAQVHAIDQYPIAAERVRLHLQLDGTAAEIMMPSAISRIAQPTLIVISAHRDESTVRVRLRCAESACLPFYVAVHFPTGESAESLVARFRSLTRARSGRKAQIVVRPGSSASLEIVSQRIRLRLQVKCLQSGSAGDLVRVRDEQTHRIYQARVIDKDHVKAEL